MAASGLSRLLLLNGPSVGARFRKLESEVTRTARDARADYRVSQQELNTLIDKVDSSLRTTKNGRRQDLKEVQYTVDQYVRSNTDNVSQLGEREREFIRAHASQRVLEQYKP